MPRGLHFQRIRRRRSPAVIQQLGARRSENGWSGEPTSADWGEIDDTTRQGFTGHEMLDNLDFVHMNGRVYDPRAARFISPDPFIDGAGHTQGWNRYAYVKNNPLSFTDPTGFMCHSTCLPVDPWNRRAFGSPLGSAGVRSYDFSSPDPTRPDRRSAADLLGSGDLFHYLDLEVRLRQQLLELGVLLLKLSQALYIRRLECPNRLRQA